jgi:hypothetical protein
MKKTADYNRYIAAKELGTLDHVWRQCVKSDIESGSFTKFSSANQTAKQFVIVNLDRCGIKFTVTSLGCSVHKIEVVSDDAK